MLVCCCYGNLLRAYTFFVLIITLIFHAVELTEISDIASKHIRENHTIDAWIVYLYLLALCHTFVAFITSYNLKEVLMKDEVSVFIYLVVSSFGFIPIIADMVSYIIGDQILLFDTSIIESTYGSKATKPIVGLILLLVFGVKCDFTAVVCQYWKELRRINSTSAESSLLEGSTSSIADESE